MVRWMYREVSVIEIREVLRAWMAGSGTRTAAAQAGVDRKTVRRYVGAAEAAGLDRECGVEQLTDELIGAVVAAVRPDRPEGHGAAWEVLCANHDQIEKWVKNGLTVVKIGDLLARHARPALRSRRHGVRRPASDAQSQRTAHFLGL